MEKIAILGGTGFIGKHLVNELADDFEIVVLSRSPEKHKQFEGSNIELLPADYTNANELAGIFSGVYGVINLSGESVGSRWTKTKKAQIYNSRILTSKAVAEAFKLVEKKPAFLLQGSAIGIYGKTRVNPDETITEASAPILNGFLPRVSNDNEDAVKELNGLTRLIHLRTGLVLDKHEGALPQMVLPFKLFAGGPVGTGKQWNSWIHICDEVRAIKFLIQNEQFDGAFNLTAPNPVTNSEMAKAIGKALNKPSFLNTPGILLKTILGEMADELLLNGIKVMPQRLIDAGFEFKYTLINRALDQIFS